MKLEIGKFYTVKYIDNFGYKNEFVGMYEGIEDGDFACCSECQICGKENHKRIHQFNVSYSTGTPEEMIDMFNNEGYETFYFGTSCINKCDIVEYR